MASDRINLSPRLDAIFRLTDKCECFADIGTDHAYLPVALCINNKCKTAIASDIVEGPLKRAEKTVSKYHQNDKISIRLGAGAETVKENEADVFCIAGMGGLIISEIMKHDTEKLAKADKIILQPMTAIPELRKFLSENGWDIVSEILAKEENKIYTIMSVKFSGKKTELSETELFLGKALIESRPDYFDEYIEKMIKKLKNIISGLEKANSVDSKDKYNRYKALLEAVIELRR